MKQISCVVWRDIVFLINYIFIAYFYNRMAIEEQKEKGNYVYFVLNNGNCFPYMLSSHFYCLTWFNVIQMKGLDSIFYWNSTLSRRLKEVSLESGLIFFVPREALVFECSRVWSSFSKSVQGCELPKLLLFWINQ